MFIALDLPTSTLSIPRKKSQKVLAGLEVSCHCHPAMNAQHHFATCGLSPWFADIERLLMFLASNLCNIACTGSNWRSSLFNSCVLIALKEIMLTRGRWQPALDGLAPQIPERRKCGMVYEFTWQILILNDTRGDAFGCFRFDMIHRTRSYL